MTAEALGAVAPIVDATWLAANLDLDDVLVFDTTTNIVVVDGAERIEPDVAKFREAHIPGAGFIDIAAELSDPEGRYPFTFPPRQQLEAVLRRLGLRQNDRLVVYSTGNPWWATRVWWILRSYGLSNVSVLDGGLKEWRRLGHRVDSGAPLLPRRVGNIVVGPLLQDRLIDAETLAGKLAEPQFLLVNALPPDRFRGETAVHNGRPGHIPGSVNLPAASLVDPETGLFRSREEIESRLRDADLLEHEGDIVAYCGGGISATLVLLALSISGRENIRLYDASLYEWGHREDLPMNVSMGGVALTVGNPRRG